LDWYERERGERRRGEILKKVSGKSEEIAPDDVILRRYAALFATG
jgi:hypothetical protein